MSDLSQTAASVLKGTPSQTQQGNAGEAITAGNACYKAANNNWLKADANVNALVSGTTGIAVALTSAPGAGQPLILWLSGRINLGATLNAGSTYVVSNTAGGICPIADIGVGGFITILGVARNTNTLESPANGPYASGTALT